MNSWTKIFGWLHFGTSWWVLVRYPAANDQLVCQLSKFQNSSGVVLFSDIAVVVVIVVIVVVVAKVLRYSTPKTNISFAVCLADRSSPFTRYTLLCSYYRPIFILALRSLLVQMFIIVLHQFVADEEDVGSESHKEKWTSSSVCCRRVLFYRSVPPNSRIRMTQISRLKNYTRHKKSM